MILPCIDTLFKMKVLFFEAEEASHVHQTTLKICKKTLVSNVSPTKFLERLQKSGLVEDNDAKEILVRIEVYKFFIKLP